VKLPDGTTQELAELRRIGIQATMVDPARPEDEVRVNISRSRAVRNFASPPRTTRSSSVNSSSAASCGTACSSRSSATLITLLFNAMAAFALSKYRFRGRKAAFLIILATLMIPPTIVLVPNFLRRVVAGDCSTARGA
jgi:alpha-1,4-digalacturonate transport system permease protein